MLIEKGADPNVVDGAGMGALYAAVDMNSLQWVQGRPAPILSDTLDGVDLVKLLLAEGRESERAPERQAAEASPRRRLDAELRRGHDAADARGANQRRGVMKALLDGGADPFLTLPDRTKALMIAAGQGYGGIRGEGIRIVVPTADERDRDAEAAPRSRDGRRQRSTTPAIRLCTPQSRAAMTSSSFSRRAAPR